jgi:quinol monooxygenase YgiN
MRCWTCRHWQTTDPTYLRKRNVLCQYNVKDQTRGADAHAFCAQMARSTYANDGCVKYADIRSKEEERPETT